MIRNGPVIGGTRNDEDTRDSDQKAYCVHSNTEPFHFFNKKYQNIVDKYQDEFLQLSLEMETFFYGRKQPEEEFNRKLAFCHLLKTVIARHNPTWLFDIVPTGSSVTGLATKDSDLDVAIHIPQINFILSNVVDKPAKTRELKLSILQIVRRILNNDEDIKDKIKPGIQLVQAQIQILKIETIDGIEVDISVATEEFLSSMHNSHLIRHFAHIDSRFAPLCAVVKQWAASTEVKKPVEGGFNSYAMVLLVVHFLQCGTSPPVLPHLAELYREFGIIAESEHNYPKKVDFGASLPRKLPEITKNEAPVAVLFFQFVHYYLQFSFGKHYISICKARIMNRKHTGDQKVRSQDSKEVYIEDPFDEHNPGRTCRTLHSIKNTFRRTMNLFIPPQDALEDEEAGPSESADFKFPTLEDILYMTPKMSPEEQAEFGDNEDTHFEDTEDHRDVPGPSEDPRSSQMDDQLDEDDDENW